MGAINGSCSNFIKNNGVGFTCPANDSDALAKLIRELDIEQLCSLGKHSKDVYLNKYSKSIFTNRLISVLNSMNEQRLFRLS